MRYFHLQFVDEGLIVSFLQKFVLIVTRTTSLAPSLFEEGLGFRV